MEEPLLQKALRFALDSHRDQLDKAGEHYILHPLRVMLTLSEYDIETQVAALLHDVVEDCGITVDYLRAQFGDIVAEVVDCLSRRKDETYQEFIIRAKANDRARSVKLADLDDNTDPDRPAPTDHWMARRIARDQSKYYLARAFLQDRISTAGYLAVMHGAT